MGFSLEVCERGETGRVSERDRGRWGEGMQEKKREWIREMLIKREREKEG